MCKQGGPVWVLDSYEFFLHFFCPASCRRELMYQVSSQATKGPPSLPPPSSRVVCRGNPVSLSPSPSLPPLEPLPCANVIVRARYKTSLPRPPRDFISFVGGDMRRRGVSVPVSVLKGGEEDENFELLAVLPVPLLAQTRVSCQTFDLGTRRKSDSIVI